jgi:hypothetical protein
MSRPHPMCSPLAAHWLARVWRALDRPTDRHGVHVSGPYTNRKPQVLLGAGNDRFSTFYEFLPSCSTKLSR